jgi:hypothetical protein
MHQIASVVQMTDVIALSEEVIRFNPRSGQTKDYTFDICCFSAEHLPLKCETQVDSGRDNVSEWSYMSTLGLLFQ